MRHASWPTRAPSCSSRSTSSRGSRTWSTPDSSARRSISFDRTATSHSRIRGPTSSGCGDTPSCLFRHELHELHQRLRRLLQPAARVELELAVELVPAGKDVRARQSAERELRAIGAAADRLGVWLEPRAPSGLARIAHDLGMLLEHLAHVAIVLLHIDLHRYAGQPRRRLARELA